MAHSHFKPFFINYSCFENDSHTSQKEVQKGLSIKMNIFLIIQVKRSHGGFVNFTIYLIPLKLRIKRS